MFRGHIDLATRNRVEGWLHCKCQALRDYPVLAFIGAECVGEGVIDVFRGDLVDANLGDGWSGFSFAVQLTDSQNPADIVVRLADTDAYILQRLYLLRERICDHAMTGPFPAPRDLNWMLAKGWLSDANYQKLRVLSAFGVSRMPIADVPTASAGVNVKELLVNGLSEVFDALVGGQHQLDVLAFGSEQDLRVSIAKHRRQFPKSPPVWAFWASRGLSISIVEASYYQLDGLAEMHSEQIHGRGTEYSLTNDSALLMNVDSKFGFRSIGEWTESVLALCCNRVS